MFLRLVRFCFTTLNNRDLNESVKKTTRCVVFSGCPKDFARCGASYRLQREPQFVNLPASEEKKKASGFRLTKNGAQQGARRLDKKNYL